MKRLRVVLITRRFWPLIGGAEMTMANLAAALVEAGHGATILTAAWDPDWPMEINHRGVPLCRVPQSERRMFGTWEYMRGVARWLRKHRREFDVAYVSMLKHDAYAAIGVGRRLGFPVIGRAEGGGPTGDVAWQRTARLGGWIRRRVKRADAIVAPSSAIEQELLGAGYPREKVRLIPNGVAAAPERTLQQRRIAREALGTAHPVLWLGHDTKLAVYTGRLSDEKGLTCLIDAWNRVLRDRLNTRLWLVGQGPERDRLAEHIERLNLMGRAVLVGTFDSVEELLAAADLFVLPSREEGMSIALLEAMANGLPIVATDIPGNRALITSGQNGLLVPPDNTEALAAAINQMFDTPTRAAQYGAAARERAQNNFALSTMVVRHLELFNSLL